MKHATLNLMEILIVAVCLLMAMPACANYKNPGLGGSDSSSFSDYKGVDGKMKAKMAAMRMPFVANEGQMDENVKFYANTFGGTVFVTREGKIVYSLPFYENEKKEGEFPGRPGKDTTRKITKGVALHEELVKGRVKHVVGEGTAATKVNYLKGRDQSKWKNNVTTYEMVNLGEVYDGVDVKLRAHGNNVEKLFFVRPGADADAIRIRLDGADAIKINETGGLEMETELGPVSFTAPLAHQEGDGKKQAVKVAYVVKGNEYGFRLGEYDKTKELVIDPLLASTFLGGGTIGLTSMAIDQSGNVYATGYMETMDIPASPGAYSATIIGSFDAFILKMDSDLETLLAFTYLGGDYIDHSALITLDASGDVYISGWTLSMDFPVTPGAYDENNNNDIYQDVFISKLNGDLTTLLSSTLLGGGKNDYVRTLSLDQSGNVYVGGSTASTDYPGAPGPYYPGDADGTGGFISKLDGGLASLIDSKILINEVRAMAFDQYGNIYITGATTSDDFHTTSGAYSEIRTPFSDIYITKLDSDITEYLASTLLGGDSGEMGYALAIDQSGNVYVTGRTLSTDFPTTPTAFDRNAHSLNDLFISKLNSDLTNLLASTYLGGNDQEDIYSLVLDQSGRVYVSGRTQSTDFPTTSGAYSQSKYSDYDAFISKLDGNLSTLLYSTFLGENGSEGVHSIQLDQNEYLYAAGFTTSVNFPTTPTAYHQDNSGAGDVFISKFDLTAAAPYDLTISSTSGGSVSLPGEGTFTYVAGATVDLVASPDPGPGFVNWTGDVSTIAEVNAAETTITMDGDYAITANFVVNEPPTITIFEPNGDDTADSVFFILWTDWDADDDANVSLYYDTDGVGEDGTLIVTSIHEDFADGFSWDLSGLINGDYYVYAVIDDGVNPAVVDYSDGPLTVNHASHFSTAWSGNPYDRMRLWTWSAAIDGVDLEMNDEIGVFDGAECVGWGVISGPISDQNPLIIISSKDDGDDNGFTEGAAITFKIWDASEQEEITAVTPQFFDLPGGNPISPPNFTGFGDYALELAVLSTEDHTIPLTAGWNIFSAYTTPLDPDMLSVLRPLIDEGFLLKATDEVGHTVLKVGGVWDNSIDNLDPREGYKIKVSGDVDLVVHGSPNALPMTIPLAEGWNIMGWPSAAPQNVMTVVEPLFNPDVLEKVIDEKGDALLEVLGSWVNQIVDFQPGEGYVVKLSGAADLTIYDAAPRRRGPRESQNDPGGMDAAAAPSHFTPAWSGKPNRRMNLWVAKAMEFKLLPGNEIGVFDGERCVGVGVVEGHISRRNILTIMTSRDDGSGNGFVEGRPISFKVWSERKQREIVDVVAEYFDISNGAPVAAPGFEGNGDYGVTLRIEE